MARTKKVGITGRYGSRYGSTIRKRVRKLEEKMKMPHRCPRCRIKAIKRKSVGVWVCKKCGFIFSGGAYIPLTDAGKMVVRIARRTHESKTKS